MIVLYVLNSISYYGIGFDTEKCANLRFLQLYVAKLFNLSCKDRIQISFLMNKIEPTSLKLYYIMQSYHYIGITESI